MTGDPPWAHFAERLRPARNYWLATTDPVGAPHVAPIWGVILNESFCFYSERRTAKARNIAHDPRVGVHLESATDVVIVHGRAEELGAPADNPDLLQALTSKYIRPRTRPICRPPIPVST